MALLQRDAPAWGRGIRVLGPAGACLERWVGREEQCGELAGDAVPEWEHGVLLSISSSSSSLPSVLWEPLTISVMPSPRVLGAEGGEWSTSRAQRIVGRINPLPEAALTVSQGGQQMPDDTEP